MDEGIELLVTKAFRVLNHSLFEDVWVLFVSLILPDALIELTVYCGDGSLLLRLHSLGGSEVRQRWVVKHSRACRLMFSLVSIVVDFRLAIGLAEFVSTTVF